MNQKQLKRLRRLGFEGKRAKNAWNSLQHDQKHGVLVALSQQQFLQQLEENMKKLNLPEEIEHVEE